MIKIDFIAPPFCGHLYPMIELARPLLENSKYKIRFITGVSKIGILRELGFEVIPILKHKPTAFEDIANTKSAVRNNPFLLLSQLKHNLSNAATIKQELRVLLSENNTDIVIADFATMPSGIVCDELGIKWITSIPIPLVIETKTGTPSYCGGLKYSDRAIYKFRDYIARKMARLTKKTISFLVRNELRGIGCQLYREDGSESIYSPYAILGLGFEAFEFKRDWPENFKFIGVCCDSPDKEVELNIPFNNYKKSVLITLGTHLEWAKKSLKDDVNNLSKHFKDILFIVSLGEVSDYHFKQSIDNVYIYGYIPYSQYIDKFSAVIHHAGAGIVYSCIKHQKPSLVMPCDYDQFDYASRIEYHNLGKRVKKIDSKTSVKWLRRALNGYFDKYLAQFSSYISSYNTHLLFENEIDRLVSTLTFRDNGSNGTVAPNIEGGASHIHNKVDGHNYSDTVER